MVSALRFKGEKPLKKRKRTKDPSDPASTSSKRRASSPAPEDLEGWTSATAPADLIGPLIFCHVPSPDKPPLLLSSDAEGTVFTSALPPPPTSVPRGVGEGADEAPQVVYDGPEPETVQQVWTLGRIHGSEVKFSLKAHTGRYLGVDKYGMLSATREAIGVEEQWELVEGEGEGRWGLKGWGGKWVGIEEGKKVRGDREECETGETWWVRCQKRNKSRNGGGGVRGVGEVKDRVSRKELEEQAGVPLDDEQVRVLRKARREGRFHEALLDLRVKFGKHDKFAY